TGYTEFSSQRHASLKFIGSSAQLEDPKWTLGRLPKCSRAVPTPGLVGAATADTLPTIVWRHNSQEWWTLSEVLPCCPPWRHFRLGGAPPFARIQTWGSR